MTALIRRMRYTGRRRATAQRPSYLTALWNAETQLLPLYERKER